MSISKPSIDKEHFKRKLQQRYGITITNEEYFKITKAVRTSGSSGYIERALYPVELIGSLTNSRTAYWVWINGIKVKVIYSGATHRLVTCLDEHMALYSQKDEYIED